MLVGCPRDRERAARSEVQYFIGDLLGDGDLMVSMTRTSGLITCQTSSEPFEVVRKLREFAIENPYQFRFAIRFTPMERCVTTDIAAIAAAVAELKGKIAATDSFRVTVRKRHSDIETMGLIQQVAAQIPFKVDLDNPDWTVWIEIIGESSGVSVLKPANDILSIMTMRGDIY